MFDNVNTFYGGTVARGTLTPMQLELDGQGIALDGQPLQLMVFVEEGGSLSVMQTARFDNAQTFYGGAVSLASGPQAITQSARFDNANTFYGGVVSQSSGVHLITQTTRFGNQNVFFGGSLSGGIQSSGPGYEWVYLEPRQWWKRKPKDLPIAKAKAKIRRIAKVLDAVAEQQVEAGNVTQASIVDRIRPYIEQMPGFDWRPLYQAILDIRQAEIARQQADKAVQDAIRRAMEQDEEDIAILLLSM
jgi:hypothetical protein